jgi:ABC-type uncharacterized transport system substrate-binding protein
VLGIIAGIGDIEVQTQQVCENIARSSPHQTAGEHTGGRRVSDAIEAAHALHTNDGRMSHRDQVVKLANRYTIPAIYQWREFVDAGGLISYGPSITDAYYQTGVYVAQILNGAKPAELPVMQPTRFELAINLKTAEIHNLSVPSSLLARADITVE